MGEVVMTANKNQQKYLEEYERHKHLKVVPGIYEYGDSGIKMEVVSVNEETEKAVVRTVKSGMGKERTFHWVRKRLLSE